MQRTTHEEVSVELAAQLPQLTARAVAGDSLDNSYSTAQPSDNAPDGAHLHLPRRVPDQIDVPIPEFSMYGNPPVVAWNAGALKLRRHETLLRQESFESLAHPPRLLPYHPERGAPRVFGNQPIEIRSFVGNKPDLAGSQIIAVWQLDYGLHQRYRRLLRPPCRAGDPAEGAVSSDDSLRLLAEGVSSPVASALEMQANRPAAALYSGETVVEPDLDTGSGCAPCQRANHPRPIDDQIGPFEIDLGDSSVRVELEFVDLADYRLIADFPSKSLILLVTMSVRGFGFMDRAVS
jgi:hypothetical protein